MTCPECGEAINTEETGFNCESCGFNPEEQGFDDLYTREEYIPDQYDNYPETDLELGWG
ncbi:MAG: hypothetical protein GY757_09935 [bacterium]|nr:hypothetical protein [bacterium]